MDIDEDITQLRLEMVNDKYKNMLENISDDELGTYINKLRSKEINNIKPTKEVVKQSSQKQQLDTSIMYKRPWSKLQNIHRYLKIEEFLVSIKEIDDKQREKLIKKITELLKDKIITKKNEVEYDEKNGCVVSIKRLVFDKKKNKYVLN